MSSNTTRKTTRARGVCLRADEVRTLRDTGAVVVRRRVKARVDFLGAGGKSNTAEWNNPVHWGWEDPENPSEFLTLAREPDREWCSHPIACPLGAPGDPLWGREAWRYCFFGNHGVNAPGIQWGDGDRRWDTNAKPIPDDAWRSAATMPFWASRFPDLRVASVAVERATDGEAWEWVVRIEDQGRGEGGA